MVSFVSANNPLERARASYIAEQFQSNVWTPWHNYTLSDGGKDDPEFIKTFEGIKNFQENYLPESYLDDAQYNTADILIAPILVSKQHAWAWNASFFGPSSGSHFSFLAFPIS